MSRYFNNIAWDTDGDGDYELDADLLIQSPYKIFQGTSPVETHAYNIRGYDGLFLSLELDDDNSAEINITGGRFQIGSATETPVDIIMEGVAAVSIETTGIVSIPNLLFTSAGSVSRTVQAKLGETLSIADFGGGPSKTAAENKTAFEAASAYGGWIRVPAGSYNVNAFTISNAVHFYGDGQGLTNLAFATLGANVAAILGASDNIHLSSFSLTGPVASAAAYVSEECGIKILGSSGTRRNKIRIRDVEITRVGSYGVLLEYTKDAKVEDSYIHNVGYAAIAVLSGNITWTSRNRIETVTPGTASNAYGIFFSNRTSESVCDVFFCDNNYVTDIPLWEGLDTHGGKNGRFSGNIVISCKMGILVGPTTPSGTPPYRVTVIDNIIDKGSLTTEQRGAIVLSGSSTADAIGLLAIGNVSNGMGPVDGSSATGGAIILQYLTACKCNENILYDSYQNGIIVATACTNLEVANNQVHGINLVSGNAAAFRTQLATTGLVKGNWFDAGSNYSCYFNASTTGLQFDESNHYVGTIINPSYAGRGFTVRGSTTVDLGNLVDGAGTTGTVTVNGAQLGDYASVSLSLALQGLIVTAWVSAVNTVSYRVQNETGSDIDLTSLTVNAKATRP